MLTNISITKKYKILFAILYYVYIIFILSLYIDNFFSNKFISINNNLQTHL